MDSPSEAAKVCSKAADLRQFGDGLQGLGDLALADFMGDDNDLRSRFGGVELHD